MRLKPSEKKMQFITKATQISQWDIQSLYQLKTVMKIYNTFDSSNMSEKHNSFYKTEMK